MATRTLKQIATDEGEKFPLATPVVETDFYVVDLVTGVDNEATAVEPQRLLVKLLEAGGMKLHKWSSKTRRLLQDVPQEDYYNMCHKKTITRCTTRRLLQDVPQEDYYKMYHKKTITRCTTRRLLQDLPQEDYYKMYHKKTITRCTTRRLGILF
ncbi:hypothetical protein AVEN_262653-1 [Araneus ventricosus]|uniref:Uncharacterized protein n=1 Tax=Araneus ventricosus TaxID=182803 RepID=A0A4Y2SHY0_ARAVE|nr:hypothetical protein AVEN_79089-1 [Araneus ventricosus]GBN87727.1 hypothetical protein AVEN_262653-1 [Araneus ventricosus]